MSWAALFGMAQATSALAAACADDLAAGMAASGGLQADCEAVHAEADAQQEREEARMAHEAEMDGLHSSVLAGGWASEEEEWGVEGAWGGEFW